MKASVALSALTMAVIAIAAPADIEARGDGDSCSKNHVINGQKRCCSPTTGLGILDNLLSCSLLSSSCSASAYCCQSNSHGLIVVSAANCVAL